MLSQNTGISRGFLMSNHQYNVDIITKCVKTNYKGTIEQTGEFRKSHHFTVMQPLKPEKDNTYAVTIPKMQDEL